LRTAAQVGKTTALILRILHGLLSGRYPQGFIVAMPTEDNALAYSKSRFAPLIQDNAKIRSLVSTTDSASLKRVGSSFISFVGSQLSTSVGDTVTKRTSTALVSTPADGYLVDEVDRVPSRALDLLAERLSHSLVKHEFFVSTPTIPGYGIDALFQETDQRAWQIKCGSCGEYTCLETEFPNCLVKRPDATVVKVCRKCGREIFTKHGLWVPAYPGREAVGYHISQLNSEFVKPAAILKAFEDNSNPAEFFNSKLGLPYLEAENRLTPKDVFACCGDEPMASKHRGPAAIGIDVGRLLHCAIAVRLPDEKIQVVYAARVSSFEDVSSICDRFGVKVAVVDTEPETRAVREWQDSVPPGLRVFLCDYQSSATAPRWDDRTLAIRANRTECLDAVHHLVTVPGKLILPKRNAEIEEFAKELCGAARMVEEDSVGSRRFTWRRIGPDHYFHAMGYCLLATSRIGVYKGEPSREDMVREAIAEQQRKRGYDPLTWTSGYDPFAPGGQA